MKKIVVYLTAAAMALTVFGFNPIEADAAVKSNGIARDGSAKKTVYVGKRFELEVETGSKVRDSHLRWSVGNSKVVKIADKDRTNDEITLKAVKSGKTKVYCKNKKTGKKVSYTITVKKPSKNITRVGSAKRSYKKGTEFELKVKLGGKISSNKVKWSIGNTKIVGYDDDDRYDNDMEFKAKKAGTTKITAKNLLNGKKIVYTVKVTEPPKVDIARVGSSVITIEVGDDEDLKVTKGANLSSKKIQWIIEKPQILAFEDGVKYGTKVEVEAKKAGTTKVTAKNLLNGKKIVYTVKVTEPPKVDIARVGSSVITIEVGDDEDLKVTKGANLANNKIQWVIQNPEILAFEDGVKYGTNVEVKGLRVGETNVYAKNLYNGKQIVYKVIVIADPDDVEIPTVPETPTEPEIPVVPETPTEPETPVVPETPTVPETPVEDPYRDYDDDRDDD